MFHTIHRCVKLLLLCGVLAVGYVIYQNRLVFEPGWVWLDVWDNGGFNAPQAEVAAGRVKRVVTSQTFIMAPQKGDWFNVRLLGIGEPSQEITVEAKEREKMRMEALKEMIDDKWVHVELLYSKENNIGGVVYCNGTNINAALIHRGLARTKRDFVKGFPKEAQYSMLWAQRHRGEAK